MAYNYILLMIILSALIKVVIMNVEISQSSYNVMLQVLNSCMLVKPFIFENPALPFEEV